MKTREGFVSNSSATSFIITNTSKKRLSLVDFVDENPQLLKRFNEEYRDHINPSEFRKSADARDEWWEPGEARLTTFGDAQGTLIGAVFDYILRDGGMSANWRWRFEEFNR
jgi:hypothetical protein